MKLGFDAKWFFRGPPSGRRIVQGLSRSLCTLSGGDELHLFLDGRYASEWRAIDLPRTQQHYVWARNNQIANIWHVARAADRLGLDAVAYQNFVPPSLGARHSRVAFVHDVIFHESPQFFTGTERLYFSTVRPLTRSAERVCTVSQSEKSRMARLGFAPSEKIDVVPYGIDDVFIASRGTNVVDADILEALGVRTSYLLYVGRLTVRKNVATLVRAMREVKTTPLELVVVGASDSTEVDLVALARELGISNRVRFLGPIYDDRLATLYAGAAAFCFPTWDESYGLPPLEAMGRGIPCIVSDIPVLHEMYGDAATYADPRDPSDFARKIDQVMASPELVAQQRESGKARAGSFTWDRAATLLLQSLRTAAQER